MAKGRREHRHYSRIYDDGWRSTIMSAVAALVVLASFCALRATGALPPTDDARSSVPVLLGLSSAFWIVFVAGYLGWTHVAFSRLPRDEQRRIAGVQYQRTPNPVVAALLGRSNGTGTISAASVALLIALGLALVGRDSVGVLLLPLVVLTVAASWAAMVYSSALRYLRLDAGGERITFDIAEEPEFTDFLSMAVLVSAVGATPGGTARTRAGLQSVRTHTLFAFAFNAFIVAMTASLVVTFVAS